MPTLPPGSPNNTSVTPIPTLVFTPTPGVQSSVRIWNPGGSVVYVGGSNLNPANGLPIYPGNRPVELQNLNVNLYACSGVTGPAGQSATLSAPIAAGASTFSSASTIPVNSWVQVGNNNTGIEYALTTSGSTGSITVSQAFKYDHANGVTVQTFNVLPSPVSIQAGIG